MTEPDIFAEALLRTDPAARAAFLDEACGPAGPLRARVERLLAAHAGDQGLLDRRPGELLAELADPAAGPPPAADRESAARQLAPFLAPPTRPGALGRLGHYELLDVLGHGGFGIVVKAHDDALDRRVAVKVLAPHVAATSPPRKRFLREARAAAAVRDEHVVQTYAVEEQPLPYLVMEFVDGQTVQQRLDASGPLDPAEVARLGRQVALGLAAAHEKGLVHRDVKPANILLEAGVEPRVKLTDFGLARAADDASLTRSGTIAGSPLYMAPEQARGEPVDHRADLFSLGSVLYAMAAGRPAFRAPTTFAVLKRVAEDAPRPLREVKADVPPGLAAVIGRLMAKRPGDRFATAREAADALARCLTDPTFARRRPGWRRPAAAAAGVALLAAGVWGAAHLDFSALRDGPTGSADPTAPPPALVVNSTRDDGSPGTLRWAVEEANRRPGEDAITFDPAAFAAPQTITLTRGPIALLDPAETTITGPAAGLTVSGDDRSQVFVVGAGDAVTANPARASVADLTIAHGRTTDENPGGGGVLCRGGARLALTGCTLRDNAAPHPNRGGGGVYNSAGTLVLTNCTFARNQGHEGGAVKNYAGTLRATNCTFVGNAARAGDVVRVGGGIYTGGLNRARTVVNNCLFANREGGDLFLLDASEVGGDHNLSADGSAPGPNSRRNADALVGPLGRHGGPTETAPLTAGSPAVDAGDNDHLQGAIPTDQRGLPRVANGKVDIGAFELR